MVERRAPGEPYGIVEAVREVRLCVASEWVEESLRFYRDLLCLPSQPPDRVGSLRLGDCKGSLILELRHDPSVDPVRRRLSVRITSLAWLRAQLDEKNIPYEFRQGALGLADVVLLHDPLGHLIEVRESRQF